MKNSEEIWSFVEAKRSEFCKLSDRVWETPELNYEEYRSAEQHVAMLEQEGFRVTNGIAGIPTAMMGEAGDEGPVIAILGEFDTLPGLSQEAGVAVQKPVVEGGHGHGCGHNLLGAGSMWAATAVKDYLHAHDIKGRVRYYGCPAEEGGSSKGFMVRAGVFDEADKARAAEFQKTFSEEDIESSFKRFGLKPRKGVMLCDVIFPPESGDNTLVGSTDVGTASWSAP